MNITVFGIIFWIAAAFFGWIWLQANRYDEPGFIGNLLLGLGTIGFGLVAYHDTGEEAVKRGEIQEAKRIEERRQERTPRFYADAPDGCKVYTFKPGDRWLYFTRCPNAKTSTETSWTEQCGKNCSKVVSSTIETTTQ